MDGLHGLSRENSSAASAGAVPHAAVRDPVCGMTVDPQAGKPSAEHGGRSFHFCSAGCKAKFEADPESYLTAVDPVCGMAVDRASAEHFLRRDGAKHYFCSAACQQKFEADPERHIGAKAPPGVRRHSGFSSMICHTVDPAPR
jgi:Cu+-exporting ATPase